MQKPEEQGPRREWIAPVLRRLEVRNTMAAPNPDNADDGGGAQPNTYT